MAADTRRTFTERCVRHPVHREHLVAAVLIVSMEMSISLHAPEIMLQVLMTIAVFGRDFLALMFDEIPEYAPVKAEVNR